MNRRNFLIDVSAVTLAGGAFGVAPGVGAQNLRPAPPTLTVARGAQPLDLPVELQAVRIDAEISGSRALTTVEMTFFNPNGRVLEGELQFPLLDGQQVSGFALDIDGQLREAVPVEKAKGQQVFEDVIRARIDPALLQTTIGNNYKLRVYPLPARGTRRVVIRYAETLPVTGELRRYRLPLDYAKQLPGFNLRIVVRAPEQAPLLLAKPDGLAFQVRGVDYEAQITRSDFAARGLLDLQLPASTKPEVRTQNVAGATYFVAEVPAPRDAPVPRKLPAVVGLIWDASGSGAARDHALEFALLDIYFKRMGEGEVCLTRVRDAAEPTERFSISGGDWSALKRALESTAYDGATQLGAFTPDGRSGEYLLFSDGLDNYGERPFAKLTAPLYTVNAASRADTARLRQLSEASGGRFVDLTAHKAAEAASLLLHESVRLLDVTADHATLLTTAARHAEGGRWLVAGQLTAERTQLRLTVGRSGLRPQVIEIAVDATRNADALAAAAWAQQRVTALDAEYRLNKAEIRRLGLAFNLPTRETSLIVLDRIEDYVRHDIVPPPELRAAFDQLRRNQHVRATDERTRQLNRVLQMFKEKIAWWEKDFPKNARPQPERERKVGAAMRQESSAIQDRVERDTNGPRVAERRAAAPPPSPAMAPAPMASGRVAAKADDGFAGNAAGASAISIQLKRATPDAPYFARFRDASSADLYRLYLDERASYANSTAFFLDAADAFFEKGLTALGVRVLSNLAEMDLENRHILRILGYRLMQAGQAKLAIPILARVLELAPNEPQSYRDLALAFAADRQWQKAVDNLNEVVIRPWHGRFPDIELTALDELNAIIATADSRVDTSRIDPRVQRNLPVDLRVALSWDADNTDIDLWVTDPNGEKAYYGNRITYQGGRMSQDYTGGYGPETFALKQAKPGKYKIEANFFGHRQQIVAGATTLQLNLTTRFGTREQKAQAVTLRLKGQSEVVLVGEFEVK